MQFRVTEKHSVEFRELDAFSCDLLRRLAPSGASDDGKSHARLFPAPTGGADPEADEEWREFVEPGLRQLFEEARETIAHDLGDLPKGEPPAGYAVRIPPSHLEAWLNGLNQARLALAERHGLTEREFNEHRVPPDPGRRLALAQCEFYGMLQELFIRVLEESGR